VASMRAIKENFAARSHCNLPQRSRPAKVTVVPIRYGTDAIAKKSHDDQCCVAVAINKSGAINNEVRPRRGNPRNAASVYWLISNF
jgi:hypothetical protein